MSLLPQKIRWLNLEYLFDQLLNLLRWLWILIKKLILLLADVPIKAYFIIAGFVFIAVMAFLFFKLRQLERKIKVASMVNFKEEEKLPQDRAGKWKDIKNKINSDNIEDWKEAIIMADSILDDIFSRIGYKMDGLGEKLKNIEPSDFENLQEVWDAYKIRSRIAREGVHFEISHEEAKSALAKYEKGLKELKYI